MEVYVARQPIFDRRMNVFGYELLYRRSMNNFYEGIDDNQATAALINNAFWVMQLDLLTDGTKAFINFSEEMLVREIPLLLSKDIIVIEILERVKVTDKIIEVCKSLKKKGYIIALDDFIFHESYLPLIEQAHIIKIEFCSMPLEKQRQLIKQWEGKIQFLAEKIETREAFQMALGMGYDYFQGYFFSKPIIEKGKEINSLNSNLMRAINEINLPEPDYQKIAEIIEADVGLSYKILKGANSIFFGSRHEIISIKQALVRMGMTEIKKWVYLMMLKGIQQDEKNQELIKTCLIRSKIMEMMAFELGVKHKHLEFFLAGMFSSIDALLGRKMEEILKELPLSANVHEALLGKANMLRQTLDFVLEWEMTGLTKIGEKNRFYGVTQDKLMDIYIEALKWVRELDY